MRGAFDEEEPGPVKSRRDRELTLGSGALLALFGGLALLCAVCFGLGYALGHRGSAAAAAAALPAPAQPIEASNTLAKPSATAQADQAPPADPGDPADGAAPDPNIAPNAAPDGQAAPAAMQSNGAPGQPAVHPALVSAPAGGQAAPAVGVQPPGSQAAPAATGSVMVQIAAVSHAEDADVLANALRKRGYAVTERRDPADNLIHVRIGPFATLAEANSWRTKLLGDGYNAVVQQ
jgi:DedD protein